MHTKVDFRLRKDLDADLISATAHLAKKDLNELSRNGLRLMLGIRTTRSTTITEKPLNVPVTVMEQNVRTIPGKPAVFVPKKSFGGEV